MKINVTINGEPMTLDCEPHDSLRRVLRREGFFSVRFGAETGETGAAAVRVDGKLGSPELLPAAQVGGLQSAGARSVTVSRARALRGEQSPGSVVHTVTHQLQAKRADPPGGPGVSSLAPMPVRGQVVR